MLSNKPLSIFALLLIVLLAACGGNTAQSTPTQHKLVVFISGLGSSLSDSGASQNNHYGFDPTWKSMQTFLQETSEFKGAQYMTFSYRGFTSDGKPGHYFCQDTFNNRLLFDVSLLNQQITQYLKSHHGTSVYIIAHSLGGVVAFGYMAQLIELTHTNVIKDGSTVLGTLAGVSINDSPLGGVVKTDGYNIIIKAKARLTCDLQLITYGTIYDLQELFQTATSPQHQGETASILNFLGGNNIKNQKVASDAANAGIRLIVDGNTNDPLWRPDECGLGPAFLSTEFLNEIGSIHRNGGSLYSRSFTYGEIICADVDQLGSFHSDVLLRNDVQHAIYEVFIGQPLNELSAVTSTSPVRITVNCSPPSPAEVLSGTWSGQDRDSTLTTDTPQGSPLITMTLTINVTGNIFSGRMTVSIAGGGIVRQGVIKGTVTNMTCYSLNVAFTDSDGKDYKASVNPISNLSNLWMYGQWRNSGDATNVIEGDFGLQRTQASIPVATPQPTQPSGRTPIPGIDQFIGTWWVAQGAIVLKINADGSATYQANRVYSQIQFTNVQGNTANGTVVSGNSIPAWPQGNPIPVGGSITVTLLDQHTLQVSNGTILCPNTEQCAS